MARLAGTQVDLRDAVTAILICVLINTISKSVMAAAIGGRRIGLIVSLISACAIFVLVGVHVLVGQVFS